MLINQLLYINFRSLKRKIFLKDLKSTLPSSVALSFLNLGIGGGGGGGGGWEGAPHHLHLIFFKSVYTDQIPGSIWSVNETGLQVLKLTNAKILLTITRLMYNGS